MANSNFRGPVVAMGATEDSTLSPSTSTAISGQIVPTDGPSLFYQGMGMPDIRQAPFLKDSTLPGAQAAIMSNFDTVAIDAVPQTFSSTVIAATQVATSGTAMSLVTATLTDSTVNSQFLAVGVPILPQGTSIVTTAAVALDFGFSTGTTTANSTVVNTPDNTLFYAGQWVVLSGVGSTNASTCLIAQVMSTQANFTGVLIDRVAATGMCCTIGQANIVGPQSQLTPPATQFGPSAQTATYHSPRMWAGAARVPNPKEMLARSISISVASAAASTGFIVSGWDVWSQVMSELITVPVTTGATTIFGKKAFKYIGSVVPQASQTAVSVGIGDTFGLPYRADQFSHTIVYAGATSVANNVGFTAAISTTGSPATNTTGDVRGTWSLSANAWNPPISSPATTNGVLKLTVIQTLGSWQQLFATPNFTTALFGVTQA